MPKQKTHKGAAKRMKLTGKGKVRKSRAGKSHLNSVMSSTRRRRLKGTNLMAGKQIKSTRTMLGPGRS